jgi:hypothetical protein
MAAQLGTLVADATYTQKCRISNEVLGQLMQIFGTLTTGGVIPQVTLKAKPDETTDLDWVDQTAISAAPGQVNLTIRAGYWIRARASNDFAGSVAVFYGESNDIG